MRSVWIGLRAVLNTCSYFLQHVHRGELAHCCTGAANPFSASGGGGICSSGRGWQGGVVSMVFFCAEVEVHSDVRAG